MAELVDESGVTVFKGTIKGGGSLPSTWQIDADGTLNLLDGNSVIRASLTAEGRLNLYRTDGTLGAQIRGTGDVKVFDAAELLRSHIGDEPLLLGADGAAGDPGKDVTISGGAGDAGAGTAASIRVSGGSSGGGTGALDVAGGLVTIRAADQLAFTCVELGFFNTNGGPQPTGVPVTAEGIHAALVSLGLITA